MRWGTYIYHQRGSAAGFIGSYFRVVPQKVLSHLYFKRWSCDTSYGSIAYLKHRREERQHLNHLPFYTDYIKPSYWSSQIDRNDKDQNISVPVQL